MLTINVLTKTGRCVALKNHLIVKSEYVDPNYCIFAHYQGTYEQDYHLYRNSAPGFAVH